MQAGAPVLSSTEIPERTLLVGLGLASFGALLLELALTRLFSVVLFYLKTRPYEKLVPVERGSQDFVPSSWFAPPGPLRPSPLSAAGSL